MTVGAGVSLGVLEDDSGNTTAFLGEEYSNSLVVDLGVCAAFLFIELYLVARLIYTEHRKRWKSRSKRRAYDASLRLREKQREKKRSPSELGRYVRELREKTNKESSPKARRVRDNTAQARTKRWMTKLCLMAPLFNVFCNCLLITKLVDMRIAQTTGLNENAALCSGWMVFFIYLCNNLSRTSALVFLWLRQWLFYSNPAVNMIIYSPALIWISRLAGVILGLVSAMFFVLPAVNSALSGMFPRCWPLLNTELRLPVVPPIQTPMMFFFQVLLLVLFVYPFVKREMRRCRELRRAAARADRPPSLKGCQGSEFAASGDETATAERRSPVGNQNPVSDGRMPVATAGIQYTRSASSAAVENDSRQGEVISVEPAEPQITAKSQAVSQPAPAAANQQRSSIVISNEEAQETAAVRRAVAAVVIYISTAVGVVLTGTLVQGDLFVTGVVTQVAFTVVGNYCIVVTYATWKRIFFGECAAKKCQ